LEEVFEFKYVLEQFKPKPQRVYGFFAHPILIGDRFVGMLDADVDREREVLRINAVHEFLPFEPEETEMVRAEIASSPNGWASPSPKPAESRIFFMRVHPNPRLARKYSLQGGKSRPTRRTTCVRQSQAGIVAGFALAAGFVVPAQAISATSADLYVLPRDPRHPVDVYVNGALTLDDFQPGDLAGPLDLPAGDYEVALTAPDARDDSAPILGPRRITLAAGTSYTATANLDESGAPALNLFTNDIATTNAGEGRLTVRHVAAAPAGRRSSRAAPRSSRAW
jgi:hypothetical protein